MDRLAYHNFDQTEACRALRAAPVPEVRALLDAERIESHQVGLGGGLSFHYAAKQVDSRILELLRALSEEQQLIDKYRALASGLVMNTGENRRVLHHLLRGTLIDPVFDGDRDIGAFYDEQRRRFFEFAESIRSGAIRGSTGRRFRTIVQIGIGGSDLGPRAIHLALAHTVPVEDRLEARFVSNVDPDDAAAVIDGIDIEECLFVLVSKSGTTQETLTNYRFVLDAFSRSHASGLDAAGHMVAVTSETSPLARSDGFLDAFFIDDSIGGRYSSSSAVGGVILSCTLGPSVFREFLSGAHDADLLALESDPNRNGALLDALIGTHERSILGAPTTAILPYSQALSRFPAHLQQLDMESNGKRVNRRGEPVTYPTGPVIFGEPGTNGQHSFYQLLHQGSDIIPLQFIGFRSSQLGIDISHDGSTSQQKLLANLAAQIVAFAQGHADTNPNRDFPGNRPSSLIHGNALTARAAGALLAHYENKVMFQGFVWNLNSFDQEGVQLGKRLAKSLLAGDADDPLLTGYARLLGIDR